jgi:predicted CXXCH cytochrome family protein
MKAAWPSGRRRIWMALAALLAVAIGLLYRYAASGGMSARQTPSALEAFVARHLVQLGISSEARGRKNPADASPESADVAAGRDLFQTNCQVCHGYDGAGRTAAGGGMYPPPLDLSRTALERRGRTDGELFYLIRNGVRNTGMPGWPLADPQIWDLVAYIRNLPPTDSVEGQAGRAENVTGRSTYVGSPACKACHAAIYDRWIKTPMANVVRDPREHPDSVIPDLSKPDPLVTFTADDVALVYGSKWKQRYFKKVGDDYFVFPAQWDVTHKAWKPYFVKDDWWAPLYPPDNFQRPTGPLCDGCHSVNYDIEKKTVTEWNVGCERCHGPGSEHANHPTSPNIVNPTGLGYVAGNDVCIQCHSQGRPLHNPIGGKYYDWPVGYAVTGKLSDVWELEPHKLGDTTFTHFADGTAHKNRMQGNDFVTSVMYTHGVACFTCHDAHGTEYPSNLRKPAQTLCLDCHGPSSPNGPRAPTLEEHTHHKADSAGSQCVACHMPKIAQTIGDVNVRSHTFRFVTPARTDSLKIPNACTLCHADRSIAWATEALKSWGERSPWRMAR